MSKLNWEIILSNLTEAREQIEQIERGAKNANKPSEVELQIMMEHVYHHLNFAWNTRHTSTKNYSNLSDDDFNEWSKFPVGVEIAKIEQKNS